MASTRRTASGPGSGPGRGTRRTGSPAGSSASAGRTRSAAAIKRAARPSAEPPAATERDQLTSVADTRARAAARRRSSWTTRAIAFVVVMLVLIISYASSLRVYLSQRHDIAATKADIAARQVTIDNLHHELDRWNDPNYVKTQARQRLGWVVPGETGYRVIGADGRPVGEQSVGTGSAATKAPPKPWWSTMWGAVEAADAKHDPNAKPSKEPTITEKMKPKG